MTTDVMIPESKNVETTINISWMHRTQRICFGAQSKEHRGMPKFLTLREFFDSMGITEKDCQRAFKI